MSAVGAALGPSPTRNPSPDPNPSRDQKSRGGRQRETAIQSALAAVTLQQKSCSPETVSGSGKLAQKSPSEK